MPFIKLPRVSNKGIVPVYLDYRRVYSKIYTYENKHTIPDDDRIFPRFMYQ